MSQRDNDLQRGFEAPFQDWYLTIFGFHLFLYFSSKPYWLYWIIYLYTIVLVSTWQLVNRSLFINMNLSNNINTSCDKVYKYENNLNQKAPFCKKQNKNLFIYPVRSNGDRFKTWLVWNWSFKSHVFYGVPRVIN